MTRQKLNPKQTVNNKRQNDTANTAPEGARIETGWGVMGITTAQSFVTEQVSFSVPFIDKPIVLITFGGDNLTAGGVAFGNGGNNIEGAVIAKVHTITNASFYAYIAKPSGANYGANGFVYYQWMAIGV